MKSNALPAVLAAAGAALASAEAQDSSARLSDLEILKIYAADFERDPYLTRPATFGVMIGEDSYTIDAAPASDTSPASVVARAGAPQSPTFYYTVESSDYLGKLNAGEYNALTLMAKAFSTDVTPMEIESQEGFEPPEEFWAGLLPFTFHFWTKGRPEMVSFAEQKTQKTHGTNAGIFYYQPGMRSGWFRMKPGDRVNADERSRTNPFPSMFMMLEGEATAIIDEERVRFPEGNMMFVPAGVSHQFVNESDEDAFGFLFMFGEGA